MVSKVLVAAMLGLWTVGPASGVPLSPAGDGHLTVPTFVDGKGPFPFILDTGAEASGIYQWLADHLRLRRKAGPGEVLSGMTGTTVAPIYTLASLAMGGHQLRNLSADSYPNRHDNGRQAGVLGDDFMDGVIAVFDYPCRRVEIHTKPVHLNALVAGALTPVELHRAGDTVLVSLPVRLNGVLGVALLDTGNRLTKISSSFARAAGIDDHSSKFKDAAAIFGANSRPMIPREGSIGTVRFGNVMIKDAHAQIIDLPVMAQIFGDRPVMWLGADLLEAERVIYDHAKNHVWFQASTCLSAR